MKIYFDNLWTSRLDHSTHIFRLFGWEYNDLDRIFYIYIFNFAIGIERTIRKGAKNA